MTETLTPQRTFLQSLEAMADEAPEDGFSLHYILDRLDERAFGAALFLLALPCAIPFLYLVPQIVSLPMMALTLQMLAGRNEPWLPEKFGARKIDKAGLTRMSGFGRKWFGWLERISKPSLTWLTGKKSERLIALFLTAFCASILVPLPSTNTIPGIGVAIVAFGLMSRDGRLVILGLIIGSLWVTLLISAAAFGFDAATDLIRSLLGRS
ncbi:MAG: exopolysaccharide biosynthesis protein [Pseudomonadota bacterium]